MTSNTGSETEQQNKHDRRNKIVITSSAIVITILLLLNYHLYGVNESLKSDLAIKYETATAQAQQIFNLVDKYKTPIQARFAQTAEAVKESGGSTTTFKPEGDFTKDIFREVNENIYQLFFKTEEDKKTGNYRKGTVWQINYPQDEEYIYFATCLHEHTNIEKPDLLDLVRSDGTKVRIVPYDQAGILTNTLDLTVFKVDRKNGVFVENGQLGTGLSFVDDFDLLDATSLGVFGYSDDLKLDGKNLLQGDVLTKADGDVEYYNGNKNMYKLVYLDSSGGLSGAPIITVVEEKGKSKPIAIGNAPWATVINGDEYVKDTVGARLEITNLIEQLRNR